MSTNILKETFGSVAPLVNHPKLFMSMICNIDIIYQLVLQVLVFYKPQLETQQEEICY